MRRFYLIFCSLALSLCGLPTKALSTTYGEGKQELIRSPTSISLRFGWAHFVLRPSENITRSSFQVNPAISQWNDGCRTLSDLSEDGELSIVILDDVHELGAMRRCKAEIIVELASDYNLDKVALDGHVSMAHFQGDIKFSSLRVSTADSCYATVHRRVDITNMSFTCPTVTLDLRSVGEKVEINALSGLDAYLKYEINNPDKQRTFQVTTETDTTVYLSVPNMTKVAYTNDVKHVDFYNDGIDDAGHIYYIDVVNDTESDVTLCGSQLDHADASFVIGVDLISHIEMPTTTQFFLPQTSDSPGRLCRSFLPIICLGFAVGIRF